ncbi:MAG: hypothetical protein IT292_02850 [Deltaproteobacteria bacterium]|nr:hypothetical protein [Deltaproteobacteria bacterium]
MVQTNAFQFLTVIDIISRSFGYSWRIFKESLLIICSIVVIQVVAQAMPDQVTSLFKLEVLEFNATFLAILLLVLFILLTVVAALIKISVAFFFLADDIWSGHNPNFAGAVQKATAGKCIAMIALGIRIAVISLLWMILIIIPGIIYAFNRTLSMIPLLVEDKTASEALAESKRLVTSGKWYQLSGGSMRLAGLLLICAVVYFLGLVIVVLIVPIDGINDPVSVSDLFGFGVSYLYLYYMQIFGVVALVGIYRDLSARVPKV